jgi:putative ABC transport system ATP-binding protein
VAVEVRGIDKSFGDGASKLLVLKQIDLTVRKGEILMLVGPSGCGKTTLLSIIGGTLRPDSGEVHAFGQPLHKMHSGELTRFRAQHIGFIFQQFNLIPTISCAQNVAVPLLIAGVRTSVAVRKARETLGLVGLADRSNDRPGFLSGGQQQRVAIARALVHEPPMVICDEPTAALDASNGEIVMNLLANVARATDRAVMVVTHDNRIFSYADRIARMDDGRIISVKTAEAQHERHFVHELPH